MHFGWMSLALSPMPDDDYARLQDELQQGVLAERLGFDYLWLTEHNFTGECVYGDPIPFAAALAMQTQRAKIGLAVVQMALNHPVRLAVQLAQLDNLCQGRLLVGIGRGSTYNEYEYLAFGIRSDDSKARMDEGLEVLIGAWTQQPFVYQGKYFQVQVPSIRPRPYQQPHPPIWRSAITPASFIECGREGIPIMMSRVPLNAIRQRLSLYQEGLTAGGHTEQRQRELLRQASLWRIVYVAASDSQAEDEVWEATMSYREHLQHGRTTYNPRGFQFNPAALSPWSNPDTPDEEAVRYLLQTGTLYGGPTRVAEQVAALRGVGVHNIMCQMNWGGLSHDRVTASMQRFGEQVMPKFRG
jgi:alkanesulfonate monooxygenase SsuD/methylene tetrahydromethanopterin reductase-like flavin-dependent oxidoreductase (luciferase family)